MNLVMFHDWIIYKNDRDQFFFDDAFFKFVAAFDKYFDQIIFLGRTAPSRGNDQVYPLHPAKHSVSSFPYYQDIYSLLLKGIYLLPMATKVLARSIDQGDLVWLPASHPIGIIAALICRLKRKPFFFLVRQNLKEQVRHRNRGLKQIVSMLLVDLFDWLTQQLAWRSVIFAVGDEMVRYYQSKQLPAYPVIISLISEQELALAFSGQTLAGKVYATGEQIRLLSIGRLDPEKGLIYLIEAVDMLINRRGLKVSLAIVGRGKEESALQREVLCLGLSGYIQFFGYIQNGPKLYSFYQQHDLFLIPSLTGEGLPQTILEAMAFSVPVIATTVAGIPSFIHHQQNGFLVPPADSEAMAEAVVSLMDDQSLRSVLIRGGKETAALHTLEKERDRMMSKIQTLLLSKEHQ